MLLPVFQSSFSSFFVSHRCRLSVLVDEGVTEGGRERESGGGKHFCRVGCVPAPKANPLASRHRLHWLMWIHQPELRVGPGSMRVSNVSNGYIALDTGTYHSLRAPHANVFSQNTFNMFPPFALHNNHRHLVIITKQKTKTNLQQRRQQQQPTNPPTKSITNSLTCISNIYYLPMYYNCCHCLVVVAAAALAVVGAIVFVMCVCWCVCICVCVFLSVSISLAGFVWCFCCLSSLTHCSA